MHKFRSNILKFGIFFFDVSSRLKSKRGYFFVRKVECDNAISDNSDASSRDA